jgi:type IV pilus assembly protein PilW
MSVHMKKLHIKNQRGVGLIEIMVSIAIGLILILGLSTAFLGVNKTFRERQGLGELQNSERTAMAFISTGVRNAGYYPDPLLASPIASNLALVGTGDGTSYSDTLTIRFVAPSGASVSPFQGCTASLTPGNTYTNTFSVSGGNLVCTETNITTSTSTVVNLITGVDGMNISYGVDTTGAGSVTRYRPATAITTWDVGRVKTVTVTLRFISPFVQAGQPAITLTQTISNLVGP